MSKPDLIVGDPSPANFANTPGAGGILDAARLEVLQLQPGDVLCVHLPESYMPFDRVGLAMIRKEVADILPGVSVLVLQPGVELSAVRPSCDIVHNGKEGRYCRTHQTDFDHPNSCPYERL